MHISLFLSFLNDIIDYWYVFQEGVAIEIAEAVVGALKGELAATAVNAPMVPAEVHRVLLVLPFIFFITFLLV